MTEAVATERRIVRVPPAVAFGSGFGKYKPEAEKDVRKVEVKEDRVLEQLKAALRKFEYNDNEYSDANYKNALGHVKDLVYSAKDVENFSVALAGFQDENRCSEKAGHFLSALINNGKDSEYVIHTRHLNRGIDFLGYGNTKNITVEGDVGVFVGENMRCGTITVNGSAGEYAGAKMEGGTITVNGNALHWVGNEMKGGKITVNGNVPRGIGWHMQGGSITVNGNAKDVIGKEMKGGEIHLEGDYESIAEKLEKGKIYHKGKLIVDDGELTYEEWFL